MHLQEYLSTWRGTQLENKYSRFALIGLIVTNLFLALTVYKKDTVVTLIPARLDGTAEVSRLTADAEMKKGWAHFIAQFMGNITPANVNFVVEGLSRYMMPSLYAKARDELYQQAEAIRSEGLAIQFDISSVTYEYDSDKAFVTGVQRTRGRDGTENTAQRTYEFEIKVVNYQPRVAKYTVYRGPARTKKWLSANAGKVQ